MSTIKRFEDVLAWQKARELTRIVYRETSSGVFSRDYALRDQLRRASVSVMLNIAEGFARKTDRDFARFLTQSHGSAAEVQSALYVALDQQYITDKQFRQMYGLSEECSRMIQSLARYLHPPARFPDSKTPRPRDSKTPRPE
ncbi:MAG: four helix bundle protein [Planctomycetota bacterium]